MQNHIHHILVNYTILASDNPLRFKNDLLERILKLTMTIEGKIRDEKLQTTILTEKQQKHQHYHQVKLINMDIFLVKKYYLLIKVE